VIVTIVGAFTALALLIERDPSESGPDGSGASSSTSVTASSSSSTSTSVTTTAAATTTTATTVAILTGPELYQVHCAACHGAALEGGIGPELDRGSDASELSDRRFELRVTEGRREMPAFGDVLASEEIDKIIAYVRELQNQ